MVLDRDGLFGVDTPRTVGFFNEGNCTVSTGAFTGRLLGSVPAALWTSSLDGAPIATSKRLLLVHVADVQDEGTVYADATKQVLLRWGRLPHLMRRASAEVRIVLGEGAPCRVYALASDGTRRAELPVKQDGHSVSFTVDTGRDPNEATCYYEIVR